MFLTQSLYDDMKQIKMIQNNVSYQIENSQNQYLFFSSYDLKVIGQILNILVFLSIFNCMKHLLENHLQFQHCGYLNKKSYVYFLIGLNGDRVL